MNTEAVEAAAKALAEEDGYDPTGSMYGEAESVQFIYGAAAEAALAAALPLLSVEDVPHIAEQLAAMLEEVRDSADHFEHCSLTEAANLIRLVTGHAISVNE